MARAAAAAAAALLLQHVVADMLRGGYLCYYIGLRRLLPLSPPLWHAVFDENKQHRNVLCAADAVLSLLALLVHKYKY